MSNTPSGPHPPSQPPGGPDASSPSLSQRLMGPAKVIIVSSVMFAFISYWRTAAVVLCDLASTAYYIGGIVEQSIGPAAPWFILAVMLFSYAVRSVYIESCSLFVRGGVYRVVKEAMGGFLAKLSVSALMFDYILTGPTSGVSAGQYIMGLLLDAVAIWNPHWRIADEDTKDFIKRWGSVLIACAITLYFFRQNLLGIHESSGKALNIMVATTIMAVIILVWCGVTLAIQGPVNPILRPPDLNQKVQYQLAARYRLTEESLRYAEVPERVRSEVQSLAKNSEEFDTTKRFEEAVRARLSEADAKQYHLASIEAAARIVDRYEWTPALAENLKEDLPESVFLKLNEALKNKAIGTTREMETLLREKLTSQESKEYRLFILSQTAVTEGRDRVTGKPRIMWERDPDTQQLVPKTKWVRDPETNVLVPPADPKGHEVPLINEVLHKPEDPLGSFTWLTPEFAKSLRKPTTWFSLIGMIGLFIAFGHSILAMSGEETLAQVYREVEAPKLPNFKKAAFIVFVYSLLLTATISFLAVLLIPDEVRMLEYKDNLIGGLAMYVWGHPFAKLALNAFVVFVGFLILAGAVNTAIIGSNGVLNRVSEDGVMPDWFLKPHPRYGTTYRILYLIVGLQLATILFSRGNMIILGEAYAFGVVWSFVFKALAMVVLRFKDRHPREFKVPLNIHIGNVEVPIGLSLIFLVLLFTAILNFFTKEVATVSGIVFTVVFLVTFMVSEHYHEKRLKGHKHAHLEQFNQSTTVEVTPESLGLTKSYRKLVAIRSPQNLFMLERALDETDPTTTGIVVMTAKVLAGGESSEERAQLDAYDQQLMTAVVERAEKAGKQVKPLIVPTNNPLHAVLNTAKDLQAHELIMGASNKYTADEQLEQIAFYWISLHGGHPPPLTVRILTADRDISLDLAGGNRIPKISESRARTVAELRAAGVGVDRVLLAHDGTSASSDLFHAVLTMLDPKVDLAIVPLPPPGEEAVNGQGVIHLDEERARQLGRTLKIIHLDKPDGPAVVARAREGRYDLIILPLPPESQSDPIKALDERTRYILAHAHSRVMLAASQTIPQEIVDQRPTPG
jgi:amino acid transporter/nucleotide-binding universal stress UspA family protein